MDRNNVMFLLTGTILLGLIALSMIVRGNEPQPDVLWEYKTLNLSTNFTNTEHTLNEYGKKGWEVVDWEDTNSKYFLLKRRI